MRIIDEQAAGRMLPPYHGIAYYNHYACRTVSAIFPLNWIMAIAIATWAFLRFGSLSVANSPNAAYKQGFHAGRNSKADGV